MRHTAKQQYSLLSCLHALHYPNPVKFVLIQRQRDLQRQESDYQVRSQRIDHARKMTINDPPAPTPLWRRNDNDELRIDQSAARSPGLTVMIFSLHS